MPRHKVRPQFCVGDLVMIVDGRYPEIFGYVGLLSSVHVNRHDSHCRVILTLPSDHEHANNINYTDGVWYLSSVKVIDTIDSGHKS